MDETSIERVRRLREELDEALSDLEWDSRDFADKPISYIVHKKLLEIAADGPPEHWAGFDDADIKWFLKENNHDTPCINKLREEFNVARRECHKAEGTMLAFFSISQEEAQGLVEELRVAHGKEQR